jgi:hypothetical protein
MIAETLPGRHRKVTTIKENGALCPIPGGEFPFRGELPAEIRG